MRQFLVVCCLFLPLSLFSQRFGGNPPSVKWKQLNTDTARIIFPAGLDSQAQRVASLIHSMAAHPSSDSGSLSLGDKLKKINIVMQNQTTIANGYVGLGPYRSEFFLNPAMSNFDQGTISWNDQLALHEYRHVQQFNNFNTGLSKVMHVLFGEEGYAVAVNASVPDWFYEGDAVYNETVLSKQGRGRLPLFLNAYPSLWQAGKNYSWMKLRNGSLKDYVPNHYYLGYLLVNYGREKYGLDFWSKVTKDAAAFKGLFYPFQKAVKKYAGVDYKTFRNDAFNYYSSGSNNVTNTSISPNSSSVTRKDSASAPAAIFPVNKKVVTSYLFPYAISEDSLVYLKASFNRRPTFYIKDGSGEHQLRIKDISIDDQFSYRNGKIVYAAYETDKRWRWRDYSVIKLLDIETNKQQTIRHKTKYFTPDISPSAQKIAAVEVAVNGKSEIHVLDAKTGEVITRLRSAEITLFTDPKFIDENSLVCAVRLLDGRSALAIADIGSGSIERLTPPSFNAVGYPNVSGDMIFFTASYKGNDDVFALKLSDKKIYEVSNGPLGNYFVNANAGKITWSSFTAEGYQLQQMEEKDIQWTPVSDAVTEKVTTAFPVSHGNEVQDMLANTPQRSFGASKYRKGKGLLNFHSWRPYYEDPEFTFSLYGQNILNTTETELYYLYNQNDNTNAVGFNFVFGGWFPYLSLGSQYTFNRQGTVENVAMQWDQLDSRIGLSIPLSWVSGKTFNNLGFGTSYVFRNDFLKSDTFRNINFSYLSHFISWSQQVQRATQHIYPKLGYNVSLNYRHTITKYTSWQPLITAALYMPGFLPAHSIVFTGAFQESDTIDVKFSNRFSYSRGYTEGYFARMWRTSANYHFPIIYPDFGFGNILYLQRIRGNAFYDLTRVYSKDKLASADQRSAGGEIYIDIKWWNQYELTFGFRVSRLLDNDLFTGLKATVFEFILPVSIIPR